MLEERLAAFVRGESEESFGELALELFRHRYERDVSFRALCDERGAVPAGVSDWRDVPATPPPDSRDAMAEAGTAAGYPYPSVLRAAIDGSFPAACLAGMDSPPVLSLIPARENATDPALALLAERVLATWAAPESAAAVARRGVEAARARGFLAARQRDQRPTLILATAETLRQLLEAFERRALRFRLPPGSRVVEAGSPQEDDQELLDRLLDALAVPPEDLLLAYGATGLASRLYTRRDRRGELRALAPPPWVRLQVLGPGTGVEVPVGTEGALAVFDLAAPGSGTNLLTGDRARATENGVRLLGSAPPA